MRTPTLKEIRETIEQRNVLNVFEKQLKEDKEFYPCCCHRTDILNRYCMRHGILFVDPDEIKLLKKIVFRG